MTNSLAPGIAEYIERYDSYYPANAVDLDIAGQREVYRATCRIFDRPRPEGLNVRDLSCEGPGGQLPLRLYRPDGMDSAPCLIYLHGGGWVVGDLDSHDSICADLATMAGVAVLAVAYRLAPEHRHPAALDDADAALSYLRDQGKNLGVDTNRIVIGGDSAGGTLSAALCLRMRDRGDVPLNGQVLIYPYLVADDRLPSRHERSEAPHLSASDMQFYLEIATGAADRVTDPTFTPGCAADHRNLPPAFISAADLDPLRDDAPAYAALLKAAGVPAEVRVELGLIHGHLRARSISPAAADAFAAIAAAVRGMLVG